MRSDKLDVSSAAKIQTENNQIKTNKSDYQRISNQQQSHP